MKLQTKLKRVITVYLNNHPYLAVRVRGMRKLLFWVWKLRVHLRASLAVGERIDPHKTLWINPAEIVNAVTFGSKGYNKYGDRGKVLGGDWDRNVHPFEQKDVYKGFVEHFSEGKAWEGTDYYKRLSSEIDKGSMKRGMQTLDDLQQRLTYLDGVYESIKKGGYKTLAELSAEGGDASVVDEDEVTVRISRDGELLFEDGRHRLALAKVLGIKSIPVKVTVRHKVWVDFVSEVRGFAAEHKNKLYNMIDHPDLREIPALHGMERFDMIRGALPKTAGKALDIGCNWGFFCVQLERLGFECVGVEANERYTYYLDRVRKACRCKFKIVSGSIFDYKTDDHYDLVLALYIFHHFLKTEALHDQLVRLLGRLKMERMIFGCHNEDQEGMQGGYRNYTSDEFVTFILENSCLSRSRHIGTEAGRRELYLLEK